MKILKLTVSFVVGITLLMGCAASVTTKNHDTPLNTSLIYSQFYPTAEHIVVPTAQQVFALSKPMQQLASGLKATKDYQQRTKKLIKKLFSKKSVGLAYQSSANLIAAESFDKGVANCLSLTIMSYAIAQAADLPVRFQQVAVPEYWQRNGDYNMLTGHVNLQVVPRSSSDKQMLFGRNSLEVDFDPFVAKKAFNKQPISKQRVLAMFYSNIGAQALVSKAYDKAFAYLLAAVTADPSYSAGWGNLALLYRFTDHDVQAMQTYQYALKLDSNNNTVLTNMAILLRSQGQYKQADKIDNALEIKRRKNPYYHAMLADEAAFSGDFIQAKAHYKKALSLDNQIAEIHVGLAKVYFKLGLINKARLQMKQAIKLNRFPDVERQYVAKLNFLRNYQ